MNNESNNYYVSSRGILKSCDIYSKKPISCTSLLNDYPTIDNNYIIQLHKEKKNNTIFIYLRKCHSVF